MRTVAAGSGAAERLQVLHVDDDPMNLRVVGEILSAFGFDGVQARCGADALDQLVSRRFDVVLMDIHMPQMSGLEVVSRIRGSLGPERLTPIIAVTADGVSRTRAQYLELGFDEFVTKPILVSRLLAVIWKCVRQSDPEAGRRTA